MKLPMAGGPTGQAVAERAAVDDDVRPTRHGTGSNLTFRVRV